MKKIIPIFILLLISLFAHANKDFDPSKNYQGNKAMSYAGEILIIREFPEDYPAPKFYRGFKSFSFDANIDSENNTYLNYGYGPNVEDKTVNGTHPKHLSGKSFKVNKVYQLPNYEYTYVFELSNVNNSADKLKYIYHSGKKFYTCFYDFPFYTKKHIDYLKKHLIGKQVVVGNKVQDFTVYEHNYLYKALSRVDMVTNETISYSKPYHTYKVKDIVIDKQYQEISLILIDGSHTTKELYSLHYEEKPLSYNSNVRIFEKEQWDSLVNVYGLSNMEAMMSANIIVGMPLKLTIMSRGRFISSTDKGDYYACKWPYRNKKQDIYKISKGDEVVKGTLDTDDSFSGKLVKKIDSFFNKIF